MLTQAANFSVTNPLEEKSDRSAFGQFAAHLAMAFAMSMHVDRRSTDHFCWEGIPGLHVSDAEYANLLMLLRLCVGIFSVTSRRTLATPSSKPQKSSEKPREQGWDQSSNKSSNSESESCSQCI
jgi:hypothetical protein